jgi:tetratricopeptide (TPR) repeat protein
MDLYDAAIESYTRCIELINSSPYRDEMLSMLVEAETYRMQTALKLSDKQHALNYLYSYSQELDNVDEVKIGTEFENLFLEDYRLLMHIGYAEVYCDMKQAGKAYEHISAAESMIDEYGDFVDQYHAELNDVRARYYNLIGDFESALISVDNALSYYIEEQYTKLSADIEKARKNGYIILIFQHVPLMTNNPKYSEIRPLNTSDDTVVKDFSVNEGFDGIRTNKNAVTTKVYNLITQNADVIKGIFCGHYHDDYYCEVLATEADGTETVIPQYVVESTAYDSGTGHAMKITVK